MKGFRAPQLSIHPAALCRHGNIHETPVVNLICDPAQHSPGQVFKCSGADV